MRLGQNPGAEEPEYPRPVELSASVLGCAAQYVTRLAVQHLAARVEKRAARARPFFSTAAFEGEMSMASESSPTFIVLFASMASRSTMMVISSPNPARTDCYANTHALIAVAVTEETGFLSHGVIAA